MASRIRIIEPGTTGLAEFRIIQRPGTYSDNRPEIAAYARDLESAQTALRQHGRGVYCVQWSGPGLYDCPPFDSGVYWAYGDAAAKYGYGGIADYLAFRAKEARNG